MNRKILDLLRTESNVIYELQTQHICLTDTVHLVQKSCRDVHKAIQTYHQRFSKLPDLSSLQAMIVKTSQELVNSLQYLTDLHNILIQRNMLECLSKVTYSIKVVRHVRMSLIGLLIELSFPETTVDSINVSVAELSEQSGNLLRDITPALNSIRRETDAEQLFCDQDNISDSLTGVVGLEGTGPDVFDEKTFILEQSPDECDEMARNVSSLIHAGDDTFDSEFTITKYFSKDLKKT